MKIAGSSTADPAGTVSMLLGFTSTLWPASSTRSSSREPGCFRIVRRPADAGSRQAIYIVTRSTLGAEFWQAGWRGRPEKRRHLVGARAEARSVTLFPVRVVPALRARSGGGVVLASGARCISDRGRRLARCGRCPSGWRRRRRAGPRRTARSWPAAPGDNDPAAPRTVGASPPRRTTGRLARHTPSTSISQHESSQALSPLEPELYRRPHAGECETKPGQVGIKT